jgi:putative endonuclease
MTLGRWGECKAAEHLQLMGYRLLAQNWRCQHGEIDLIMQKDDETVFVEVKTRRTLSAGTPEEALTPQKVTKLIKLAQIYLANYDLDSSWRIDLVAVECDAGGNLRRCEHMPNAGWGW